MLSTRHIGEAFFGVMLDFPYWGRTNRCAFAPGERFSVVHGLPLPCLGANRLRFRPRFFCFMI